MDEYLNAMREKLAEIEHDQWMYWSTGVAMEVLPDRRERWKTEWVPYSKVSEKTKETDRIWADKVIHALDLAKGDRVEISRAEVDRIFKIERLTKELRLEIQANIITAMEQDKKGSEGEWRAIERQNRWFLRELEIALGIA